jgi:hypothetical protein
MPRKVNGRAAVLGAIVMSLAMVGPANAGSSTFDQALTYASVEAIPNSAVVDTTPLRSLDLTIRQAFVERVLACGYVDRVVDALSDTGATTSIDTGNASFAVGAGGFNGRTTASIVFTIVDSGPNAATHSDIAVLTNSLGYVFSQGSAFLLDGDDPGSFDFPANYVVLVFDHTPSIEESAALFETVGEIDPELFSTSTSGYTQYGVNYLSLQSAVPDQQFIDGYVEAAATFRVEYTPVVAGSPSLYEGGAAFPGNNWRTNPAGEAYLSRIPDQVEDELAQIRSAHLRLIDHAQRVIKRGKLGAGEAGMVPALSHLPCRLAA